MLVDVLFGGHVFTLSRLFKFCLLSIVVIMTFMGIEYFTGTNVISPMTGLALYSFLFFLVVIISSYTKTEAM